MGNLTILLVDDSRAYGRTLELALECLGFKVLAVHSTNDAIETFRQERIDVLITDYDMRVLHGDELAQCLCQIHPISKCAVISAHDLSADQLGYPFDLVLQKPIQLDELEETLKGWSLEKSDLEYRGTLI